MISICYGEDRLKAENEAKKILGKNYEVIDAEELSVNDLPTLFLGTTLFDESRKILIKGLAEHKENFDEIEKYLDTPHNIVLLENKLNGTWASVKNLKKSGKIKLLEFKKIETNENRFISFDIFSTALNSSERAMNLLKKAEITEDPYMMVGAFATSAIKNYKNQKTPKNKRVLKELANLDMMLKTTKFSNEPWLLIESFVIRLKSL